MTDTPVVTAVTETEVETLISSWWHFTAAEGIAGAYAAGVPYSDQPPVRADSPLRLLSICVLELKNGFTVTGESYCMNPAEFNLEVGKKIAYDNAVEKVRTLVSFQIKERLHQLTAL
jgi:hypothetical protein